MGRSGTWMAAGLALAVAAGSCRASIWPGPEATREALIALHQDVRGRVLAGDLARADGFAYAVDVGELLRVASRLGDREMYAALRSFAVQRLIVDEPDDPYTRGFVLWRRTPVPTDDEDAPDASGTTEALRVSEGLWEGALAFGANEDRDLALTILDGYARHASDAVGLLLIRNYFNFGSRDFATNSFLVDYAPDYVARVARHTGRQDFAKLAARSYEVVRAARSPAGLIYDVFQPEMATLFDDRRTLLYSPNDIVQTSNAAAIAATVLEGAPEVASRVLAFCRDRMPGLKLAYYGRTAEEARQKRPGIEIWGTLTEMSVRRRDETAIRAFAPFLVSNAVADRIPGDAFLYVGAHLLLGLEALDRHFGLERPLPPFR
ncbi:MAG: hypothetical protein OXI45_10685 [Acidobacteriota bacterium]|nr:hypothetical protein [Acidobacteriota bacterium]